MHTIAQIIPKSEQPFPHFISVFAFSEEKVVPAFASLHLLFAPMHLHLRWSRSSPEIAHYLIYLIKHKPINPKMSFNNKRTRELEEEQEGTIRSPKRIKHVSSRTQEFVDMVGKFVKQVFGGEKESFAS